MTVGKATNDDRRAFVSRDVTQRVLDKCPNWQWRTVVALARYGGLRCPSDVALLKWSDIHWDAERFTVTSPKTKRYGKVTRVVPIFSELRSFLDEAFSLAGDGENWLVTMLAGDADKNLGTTFRKIVRGADVGEAVPELPIPPADRVGTAVPDLRCLCPAGQHTDSCPQALPDGD